jgi:hypothetical protein
MGRLTEDYLCLDVRNLRRTGRLSPGWHGSVTWGSRATIKVEVDGDEPTAGLVLIYSYNEQPVRERVPVSWTRCHFGGRRAWFHCPEPGCGRRRALLYLVGAWFRCRLCRGMSYRCQRERLADRRMRKAERIWRRIGCGFGGKGLTTKPKGQHWRTYFRRLAAAGEAHGHALAYFDSARAWVERQHARLRR